MAELTFDMAALFPNDDFDGDDADQRGGYDVDLFKNKSAAEQYVCAICCSVAKDCTEVTCGNGYVISLPTFPRHATPSNPTYPIFFKTVTYFVMHVFASIFKCREIGVHKTEYVT